MLQFEEQRLRLEAVKPLVDDLRDALHIDALKEQIAEMDEQASSDGFWDNIEKSQALLRVAGSKKATVEEYEKLVSDYDDTLTLIELADEEGDLSLLDECVAAVDSVIETEGNIRLKTLLCGEYDKNNAIVTLHAGAGGTEAMDWALMLYRMYVRWGEKHKFTVTLTDMLDGEEAGIKSATLLIGGENAYGYLRGESGIHRLVRVSPFDSSGRRHTSFASVEVLPEIDDSIEVDIREEDIKMDVFRSSGAGGQHINKTSSAVRLTHLPTGIVVSCQMERSQLQNREVCMRMLRSKLIEIKEREHLDKISDIKGEQLQIAWGSQIRSYVFMPYTMVKDHRTTFETGNVDAVMDGEIDGFINSYLKFSSKKD